jgi:acyl-CoA thioester hydrolase
MPILEDFPSKTYDKLRYGDTDRQGHVNNAVFTTFYETGRIAMLELVDRPLNEPGYDYVIARLEIDYRAEIFWPGTVEIGTAVQSVGNSSVRFVQALFQAGKCVSTAESVVVQVDPATHRPAPLSAAVRAVLSAPNLAVRREP